MTLQHQARQALQRLQGIQSGSEILDVREGDCRLECELTTVDSLACAFHHFTLHTDALAGASVDRLKQVAEQLSRRLSYLLEPLQPMEIDADHCIVQMRSNPPRKNEDGASYYELLVQRGGQLSLCRYIKTPGSPRSIIPAQVTREVFLHLVDDFAAIVK